MCLVVFAGRDGKEGDCTFKVKRKDLLTTERIWLSNIDTSKLQLKEFSYDDDTFVQLAEQQDQAASDSDPLAAWKESKPSVNALLFVSESVAVPKWKEVCTHLGVPQKVLTHAEQTFPLGTEGTPA